MTRQRFGFALGIVILAAAGWWAFGPHGPPALSADAGRDLATAFLADVRANRVDAAWAGTSAEFKSLMGRDAFRLYARSKQKLLKLPAEFERCEPTTYNGLTLNECYFRPQGATGTIKVTLAPEGATWKVERLSVD